MPFFISRLGPRKCQEPDYKPIKQNWMCHPRVWKRWDVRKFDLHPKVEAIVAVKHVHENVTKIRRLAWFGFTTVVSLDFDRMT